MNNKQIALLKNALDKLNYFTDIQSSDYDVVVEVQHLLSELKDMEDKKEKQ